MSRGFLDDIAGSKRLRMAIAGKNARDMSLPANHVAFDSTYLASVPVILSGTIPITADVNPGATLVTWANLGGIPFGEALIKKSGIYQSVVDVNGTSIAFNLRLHPTGLRVFATGMSYPFTIHYVVYGRFVS